MLKLSRSKLSSNFLSLDTEDDSKGNVKIIDFYDGKKHITFTGKDCQSEATAWLIDSNPPGSIDVWACNAEYDIVNLLGTHIGLIAELTYLKSAFVKARILPKYHNGGVHFYDTLRHWKLGVAGMGEKLGFRKLKFDPDSVVYCQRDAEIVHRFVAAQMKNYAALGAETKATIGATALALFKSKYAKESYMRPRTHGYEKLAQAIHGGRVEIFRTGIVEGTIRCYDVNSMYPAVMRAAKFPVVDSGFFTQYPDFGREGVAHLDVTYPANIDIPGLAIKHENKLIFPVGRLRGYWSYPEIRQAIKDGASIKKIHWSYEYARVCEPFTDFITDLYDRRKRSKDELERDTLKLLMNNLFGKFGESSEIELRTGTDIIKRPNHSKHANLIWSIYVTSYARLALLGILRSVKGLLYCDTDSIFTVNHELSTGEELGELKLEGTWQRGHFVLPKTYILWGDSPKYRAKGVPKAKAKDFFENYEAEWLSPVRYRESFRRELKPNLWIRKTRRLKHKYEKRLILPGGSTKPLNLRLF